MAIIDLTSVLAADYLIDGAIFNPNAHDDAPAINAAIRGARRGDTIILPHNHARCDSPIIAPPDGCKMLGAGGGANLVRTFGQATNDIFLTVGKQDCIAENLTLWCAPGVSGGWAIGRAASAPGDGPQHATLRNITTTSFDASGYWYGGIKLCGLDDERHFGTRRNQLSDIMTACCDYVGIWLGAANVAMGNNLVLSGGTRSAVWSLWFVGREDNPCNSCKMDGPMQASVLLYSTNTSSVDAATFTSVVTDNNSASNLFTAAFTTVTPLLYGRNNHMRVGGSMFSSAN